MTAEIIIQHVYTNDFFLTWTGYTPLAICPISKNSTAGFFQTILKLLGMSSIDAMATGCLCRLLIKKYGYNYKDKHNKEHNLVHAMILLGCFLFFFFSSRNT